MNCTQGAIFSLSDFADLAQVIIAFISLFLAYYIFVYQRNKDKDQERRDQERDKLQREKELRAEQATALLREQNIKLQWFKELIVQPNLHNIESFYKNLATIKDKITTSDLADPEKEQLNEFVKNELTSLRKSFIDVLLQVDPAFGKEVKENLDILVDGITEAIFNDDLKLSRTGVYEKHIGSKISYSRNTLIAQLYNYKGITKAINI